MADHFDPYHKWLSIPPEEQPPNHYRLLGTKPFESDLDVIESAADQRMAHLRTFQNSKHGKLSQKLLNEISAARVTLLKPDKKQAYDEQLRQELETVNDPLGASFNQLGGGMTLPAPAAFASAPAPNVPAPFVSTKRTIRKKPAWILPVGISVGALVILGAVIVIILASSKKDEGEGTVAEQTTIQQTDQSRHDPTNGRKTDDNTGIPKNPADNSVDGQTNSSGGNDKKDSTTDNGDTSIPVKTVDDPPVKTNTTTPDTTETNDTATQPVEPPKPIVVDTPKKRPLPTDEEQKPVLATLEETFKLSEQRTNEEQLKLAAELLKLAGESKDSVEKFVLLRGTMKYASEGGDARLLMRAVDAIDRDFQIDRLDVASKGLLGFAESANTSDALGSLVDAATNFINTAIAEDRVELANDVADVVYKSVLKRSTGAKYRKQAYDQRNRIKELADRWVETQTKLDQLKADPADPELNLFAGKWYCFDSGNWKVGLPLLAKGSDEHLAKPAKLELESRWNTLEQQLALGDGWWDAAEQMQGETRNKLQRRAAYWYLKARRDVADNLAAVKLDKRIAEVGDVETIREQIRRDAPVPDGKRVLLIFGYGDEAKFAQQACERYFLKYDAVKSFDMNRTDYSDYHTIIAGSNNMNYWQKGEPKEPGAFNHIERFVNEGGHLVVLGSFNAGGTEHLKRFGIKTGFYQTSTFERNGRATELLIAGNEDIVPDGKMQSAGNFTVSVPHVVLLKRGSGSYEGQPALATLRHKLGRVTYTVCEPNWKGDLWLVTVLLSWVSRGSPTPDSGPTTSIEREADANAGPLVGVKEAVPVQVKEGAVGFSSGKNYGLTGWPKSLSSGYLMLSGGHEDGNTTKFKVLRNGKVVLIMSGRPNGGGGGGDWQQRIISPQQLLSEGWKPVGNVDLEGSPPCVIYERECRRGEEFTYSWEKYIPPIVVVPDWRSAAP